MVHDLDKVRGAMFGVAVGDALGWPVEGRGNRVGGTASIRPAWRFEAWDRYEGGAHARHQQHMPAGSISDDTQLTLAAARSLAYGDEWWEHLTRTELSWWYLYERGGGGASKRAARSWMYGRRPWADGSEDDIRRYRQAGGNGTAMRCLPYAVVAPDWEHLAHFLDWDAITTHGHPRAILGSRIMGWAARWALQRTRGLQYGELIEDLIQAGSEWTELPAMLPDGFFDDDGEAFCECWRQVAHETLDLLKVARRGLDQGAIADDHSVLADLGALGQRNGAGNVSAVAAVYLTSRYVSQPQQGVMAAAFARGADTDTLAAMTGGLLGILNGSSWLYPLSEDVQDHSYIRRVADNLATGELFDLRAEDTTPYSHQTRTKLYRALDGIAINETLHLGPFGRTEVMSLEDHECRNQFVRSWHMQTESGQTLLLKRVDKGRGGAPRWRPVRPDLVSGADLIARVAQDRKDRGLSEPRAGLVLRVANVQDSAMFYAGVLGFEPTKLTDRYIAFGWFALEPANVEQLRLESESSSSPAIQVYVDAAAFEDLRQSLERMAISYQLVRDDREARLSTSDPDGHAIEVINRQSR